MNYYLHHECMPGLGRYGLQPFRIDAEGQFLVGFVGSHIEIYKLLHQDVAFQSRHSFHAKIVKIQVLPSLCHKHDFLWILDSKGRFCCWRLDNIDLVSNTIVWQQSELSDQKSLVFSGSNWQFQEQNTIGTIFYTDGNFFILLHFRINEKGVFIDKNNIIRYALPSFTLRFAQWIKHSQSLFLVGLVVEQEGKTVLQVYDLEKGMGVHADSMEWRFQKVNLLHFYSAIPGEILIVTYNEVSLHNFKLNSPIRNYRTRGNYGHGFYFGEGFYGHIGEQLILFSRDQLKPYGRVKKNNIGLQFSNLCFTHCSVLSQSDSSSTIGLQTYEGHFYLLKLFQKTFTITRIFYTVGPILELCSLKSGKMFAVVSQQPENFQVSLLQYQTQVQTKQQIKLDQELAQKIIMVNRGIYIIVSSQNSNNVYRLNRNQKYQFYFQLPGGSILAAQGNFLAYDYGIFQIDYQCFALSLLVEKPILLAQATKQVIYFLDHEGNLSSFDNQAENPNLVMTDRQNDYCWGLFQKNNTLLSSNLLQPKQIRVINVEEVKELSIKGHTLVTSLTAISYKKGRFQFDQRIVVGYVDGQIHMHSLHNGDYLHSTHAFEHYGPAPVSLINCGDDTVLANYTNKQYLITVHQEQYQFTNVRICHNGCFGNLFGYSNKNNDIFIVHNDQNQGIILKRISVNSMKNAIKTKSGQSFSIKKLQEWYQTVPLLLELEDRIIVAGCRKIHLIKLLSYKIIQTFYHKLKEIVQMQQLKMGILVCGVDFQSQEHVIILNQELEQICTFKNNTKTPIRCLKTIEDQNQFYLAYDDSLTFYQISSNMQLHAVMGKKLQLHAYNLDLSDELILINDPFKYLALLQHKESINVMGTYMPPYKIKHSLFIGQEILYIDERGCLTVMTARMDSIIDNTYKFTIAFSINLGAAVSAIYRSGDSLYYSTTQGKIGVLKQINREGFDALKKIQTENLVQIDRKYIFSYWQWRDRVPAHQRIIDGEMFPENPFLRQEF